MYISGSFVAYWLRGSTSTRRLVTTMKIFAAFLAWAPALALANVNFVTTIRAKPGKADAVSSPRVLLILPRVHSSVLKPSDETSAENPS
jgi:hypothetical protein